MFRCFQAQTTMVRESMEAPTCRNLCNERTLPFCENKAVHLMTVTILVLCSLLEIINNSSMFAGKSNYKSGYVFIRLELEVWYPVTSTENISVVSLARCSCLAIHFTPHVVVVRFILTSAVILSILENKQIGLQLRRKVFSF